jgi:translation initiation factor IF-2
MNNERDVKKLSEERLEDCARRSSPCRVVPPWSTSLPASRTATRRPSRSSSSATCRAPSRPSPSASPTSRATSATSTSCIKEVGSINESDVLLASASDAIILGFNVKVENKALTVAKREGVQVKLYSIIYELIDQVKEAMQGLLDPITREKILGHARVKQVFKVNKGFVGGSVVTDGTMQRKQRARVLRDGQAVYDGGFETLRRFHG